MRPISAADAIAPAVVRMRNLLFRPFVFTTFVKLSVVAMLTEGYSGNFNFSSRHRAAAGGAAHVLPHFAWSPDMIALVAGIALGAVLLGLVVAYLLARLRFALFHCLVSGMRQIRPGWNLYRDAAGRYFWLAIFVGLVFFAVVVAVAVPFVFGFLRVFRSSQPGQFDVPAFLAVFLPLIPVILLLVCAAIAVNIVLRDLMLPHMALDNATVGEAWRAARTAVAREKGAFLLYALLRTLAPMAVMLAAAFGLMFPGIAVALILVGVSSASRAAAVGIGIVSGIAIMAIAVGVGGPLGVAVRYYALTFYGGRYARLGDLLEPPAAAPELPPAPAM